MGKAVVTTRKRRQKKKRKKDEGTIAIKLWGCKDARKQRRILARAVGAPEKKMSAHDKR